MKKQFFSLKNAIIYYSLVLVLIGTIIASTVIMLNSNLLIIIMASVMSLFYIKKLVMVGHYIYIENKSNKEIIKIIIKMGANKESIKLVKKELKEAKKNTIYVIEWKNY